MEKVLFSNVNMNTDVLCIKTVFFILVLAGISLSGAGYVFSFMDKTSLVLPATLNVR